jgi:DNA adenine methylase
MSQPAPQLPFAFAAEPVLKWAGGKQIIAQMLVRHFPSDYVRYFEPFVGGGSVALEVGAKRPVLNDQNEWLIDTYRAIRDDVKQVMVILDTLKNTEREFYRIRSINPRPLEPAVRAAHLIYLNKTCFRGLFRVNKQNQFNVPYGNYDRRYYDPANLIAFSEFLGTCQLRCMDFELAVHDATAEDFIYLDPPYHRIGGYSDFNRYTSCKFKEIDHIRLRNFCVEMTNRGVRWVQSNSTTPFIRELYKDFKMVEITNRREINLNSKDRTITELVIKNF